MIGNKLHLVSGMITSAAAGAGQDRTVEVHVAQHDVLELPAAGTNYIQNPKCKRCPG